MTFMEDKSFLHIGVAITLILCFGNAPVFAVEGDTRTTELKTEKVPAKMVVSPKSTSPSTIKQIDAYDRGNSGKVLQETVATSLSSKATHFALASESVTKSYDTYRDMSKTPLTAGAWFRYSAKETGTLTVSLCNSSFDTILRIYEEGQRPDLGESPLGFSDDACGYQSMTDIRVIAGRDYYIQVEAYAGLGGSGEIDLNLSPDASMFATNKNAHNDGVKSFDATTESALTKELLPTEYSLVSYPNPFNPATRLSFALPQASRVLLSVYNIQGRLVNELVAKHYEAGYHSVEFNGTDLPSGIYFARMEAAQFHTVSKLLLVK